MNYGFHEEFDFPFVSADQMASGLCFLSIFFVSFCLQIILVT